MSSNSLVREFHYKSASEFLQAIAPSNVLWMEMAPLTWIFRGQGDADCELKPSAWRDKGRETLQPLRVKLEANANRALDRLRQSEPSLPSVGSLEFDVVKGLMLDSLAEYTAVKRFADIADDLGLHIRDVHGPDYLERIEESPYKVFYLATNTTPLGPSYAQSLAQHHGIPTRLLDWSTNARKAAYFAAEEAIRCRLKSGGSQKLAVFAINTKYTNGEYGVRLFKVPRDQFRFLYAQDGLFLYFTSGPSLYRGDRSWPSVVEALVASGKFGKDVHPVVSLTLPWSEADDLLKLLYQERVTSAHLKPTFENIAGLMKTEWKWNYINLG